MPFGATDVAGAPGAPGATGAPTTPAFTAGLIEALGGGGNLPCWIRVALCATAGGKVAVAPPGAGAAATGGVGAPLGGTFAPPGGSAGASCAGRLMTLLMTVVLWMLA